MRQIEKQTSRRRGDTLIEVMLSISIFAMVSLLTINMMNDGINTAQRTLETEMARNEIDGQAEALRYIHNNYVAERNMDKSQFRDAWNKITSKAMKPSELVDKPTDKIFFDINNMEKCDDAYGENGHLANYQAFIINPRLLIPNNLSNNSQDRVKQIVQANQTNVEYLGVPYANLLDQMLVYYKNDLGISSKFSAPSLYPRIIYRALSTDASEGINGGTSDDGALYDGSNIYNEVSRVEGIWINVAGNNNRINSVKRSDYFDFYIRTCWHSAGTHVPSTITTVVRLYNPEVME
ncbi:prepilin-type N-terminal cleavage/methylation domain-containing protein [Candidatus Saccharibacteria bacterium]|nr:prepilin-type N-terminal cleavage/methylation domain-containing protein [Candidatus Saccharibacteria bacterium]